MECQLQRFFSTFPGRWPGVGLLLLRALVGVTAAAQGGTYLANADEPTVTVWVVGLLAIASGALLLVGFVTPGAGAIAGVTIVFIAVSRFPVPAAALFLDRAAALWVAAVAAALVLLGPGALSLDARLFGRREIVFPHDSRPPSS
jgi:uncharacterized membrane protein YphA (DoxX/SURF4 family)